MVAPMVALENEQQLHNYIVAVANSTVGDPTAQVQTTALSDINAHPAAPAPPSGHRLQPADSCPSRAAAPPASTSSDPCIGLIRRER